MNRDEASGYLAALNGLFDGINRGLENRRNRDAQSQKLQIEQDEWNTKKEVMVKDSDTRRYAAEKNAKNRAGYNQIIGTVYGVNSGAKTDKTHEQSVKQLKDLANDKLKSDSEIARIDALISKTTDPVKIKQFEEKRKPFKEHSEQLKKLMLPQQRIIDLYNEKKGVDDDDEIASAGEQAGFPAPRPGTPLPNPLKNPELAQYSKLIKSAKNYTQLLQLGSKAKAQFKNRPEDYKAFLALAVERRKAINSTATNLLTPPEDIEVDETDGI